MKSSMIKDKSQSKGVDIRKRILLPLTLSLVLLMASFAAGVFWLQKNDLEEETSTQFRLANELFAKNMISDLEIMKKDINLTFNNVQMQSAFLSKDREKLLHIALPFFRDLKKVEGISHFYFHDTAGVNFLRVHKPDFYGDTIERNTMRDALKSGATSSGIELGPLGTFTMRIVCPWRINGEIAGYIEMGKDSNIYVEKLKEMLHVESYLFISKTTGVVDREKWESALAMNGKSPMWNRFGGYLLVEQSMETVPPVFAEIFAVEEHPALLENNRIWLQGKLYHIGIIPIHDVSGVEIGDLAVLIDITGHYSVFRLTLISIGVISLATGIALTLFFYIILGRVERRLKVSRQMEIEIRESEARDRVSDEYTKKIKKQNEELKLRMEQLANAREAALNMMEDANDARMSAENAEKALKESEAKSKAIIESTVSGIITIGEKGHILSFNPAAEKIFGYSKEEVLNKNISMLMPEPYHSEHDGYLKNYIRTGKKKIIGKGGRELIGQRKDGKIIYIDLGVNEVEVGEKRMFAGLINDITERKLAEEELSKSRDALARAQSIAHLGNWEYDVVNNNIYWSDEVYRIFGVEKEAFDHKISSFIELIHPDDREYVQNGIKASMYDKKPFSVDYRIVLPDGGIRHVHEEAKDIPDEKGKPLRRIGTVQDITERKEAEREIKSLAKFPSENPFPVMQISSDGTVIYANEASKPILNVWGIQENMLLPAMKSFIAEIYAEAKNREVEVEHGKQTFSITLTPISDSNYVYAYGLDITDRKEAEYALVSAKKAADVASKVKSEFLANMSHEIRTPMTTILGMSELISETSLDNEQKEYLKGLQRAGDNLLDLVNDILDLSKIEAGRIELEEVEFDLAEEIDKVMSIFDMKAQKKGIELTAAIDPETPEILLGDPLRLRQVLVNLAGNSLKFTEKGEIKISVTCEKPSVRTEGYRLTFSVNDTGMGIPSEKLETIFEDFTQADSSTTRAFGGTGLGLTISKKLVEIMGGKIWVESKLGEGSTFHFNLNVKIGTEKGEAARRKDKGREELDTAPVHDSAKALSMLLVDDSEDNRMLVKTFLKKIPCNIDMAENGEIAVEKFMSKKYDILLMDMQMPVMDGYTATIKIRRWEKEKRRDETPIIAFTAHAFKEEIDKCLEAGCTDHIAKPVKKKVIIGIISQFLGSERSG